MLLATMLGAMAGLFPYLELINHFRWLLLAGSAVVALAAFWTGGRVLFRLGAAVLVANVMLAALPLMSRASTSARSTLRVTTFNVWIGNHEPQAVVGFLREEDADVVVLQEVGSRLEQEIVPWLRDKYPHVISCARRNCGLVLLSKAAWLDAGSSDRTRSSPPVVWARFAGTSKPYVITGLHLAYPFQPAMQVDHIDWLADRLRQGAEPQILVGDFNLTPFSLKLNVLAFKANLRRHATLGASWPAGRFVPVVLLDNLLASPEVRAVNVSYGAASHGSDHYPVTFDIALD
ncbi:endonuclease/exonuclease/phosphatase family protein [Bosea sp. NPDC003192]|uniref:endonuclease/exonuclease/phosphatase family protein n=1 Tax=Bosea sp. NPDC003192 TaxID=3390551 RepID=UPI003CFFE27F